MRSGLASKPLSLSDFSARLGQPWGSGLRLAQQVLEGGAGAWRAFESGGCEGRAQRRRWDQQALGPGQKLDRDLERFRRERNAVVAMAVDAEAKVEAGRRC